MHPCPTCGVSVPDERLELLGIRTCVHCTPQRPKLKGVMEYESKSVATLVLCETDQQFRQLKRPANHRR